MKRQGQVIDLTLEPLALLTSLGGCYVCPKDSDARRLGPLVGYAGRDKEGRQYVGDIYANFAIAEQYPEILDEWAMPMVGRLGAAVNVCLGMPMGGILFASALAREHGCRVAFAEKKITALATDTSREKSELVLSRHEIGEGDCVAIVEDVVNNLSTTEEAIRLIKERKATPMSVVCILNRSNHAHYDGSESLLIKARVHRPFPQYSQDDPVVAADIAEGNVVWKPKNEWDRLMKAMNVPR